MWPGTVQTLGVAHKQLGQRVRWPCVSITRTGSSATSVSASGPSAAVESPAPQPISRARLTRVVSWRCSPIPWMMCGWTGLPGTFHRTTQHTGCQPGTVVDALRLPADSLLPTTLSHRASSLKTHVILLSSHYSVSPKNGLNAPRKLEVPRLRCAPQPVVRQQQRAPGKKPPA
jgi:hypothetical protein